LANSWQQPIDAEPGGRTWHRVEDPSTGWLATKSSGWTGDRLSTATGGMAVDFSAVVPVGTRAVAGMVYVVNSATANYSFYRPWGDTNISNTPSASGENANYLVPSVVPGSYTGPLWLSTDYRIEIAVVYTDADVFVSYPREYLL